MYLSFPLPYLLLSNRIHFTDPCVRLIKTGWFKKAAFFFYMCIKLECKLFLEIHAELKNNLYFNQYEFWTAIIYFMEKNVLETNNLT